MEAVKISCLNRICHLENLHFWGSSGQFSRVCRGVDSWLVHVFAGDMIRK